MPSSKRKYTTYAFFAQTITMITLGFNIIIAVKKYTMCFFGNYISFFICCIPVFCSQASLNVFEIFSILHTGLHWIFADP